MCTKKNGPLRGHSCVGPSILVAMFDDHNPVAVAMMPPTLVPAAIAMLAKFGTRAVPVMAAALDHDGLGAGNRRRRDRDRTECCDDISKLLHVVLLTLYEDQTSPEKERSDGTAREF